MTSALDLVVFHWVPGLFRSFLVFLLSDSRSLGLSRSEVRGPFRSSLRRRRFPAFSDVRALVSRSFWWSDSVLLTEVRGLSGLSTLGLSVSRSLSRSEVLLGVLYDVGAFRLSPTSALWSLGPFVVGLCTSDGGPRSFWSFYSRTLGLSVPRGPRSEVLLGVLYDVGAFRLSPTSALRSLGPSLWSDSVLSTEVRGLSGLSTLGLSVSRSLEVRGPRSF